MRKKMMLFLFIFTTLLGCQALIYPYKVPVDIEPHVQVFRDEAFKRGVYVDLYKGLIFKFKSLPPSNGGMLMQRRPSNIIIHINKDLWGSYTNIQREILIVHELGHGFLIKNHSTILDCNGNSITIMSPDAFIVIEPHYIKHREKMFNELFDVGDILEECIN